MQQLNFVLLLLAKFCVSVLFFVDRKKKQTDLKNSNLFAIKLNLFIVL